MRAAELKMRGEGAGVIVEDGGPADRLVQCTSSHCHGHFLAVATNILLCSTRFHFSRGRKPKSDGFIRSIMNSVLHMHHDNQNTCMRPMHILDLTPPPSATRGFPGNEETAWLRAWVYSLQCTWPGGYLAT